MIFPANFLGVQSEKSSHNVLFVSDHIYVESFRGFLDVEQGEASVIRCRS